jgi:hypothetical protein
MQAVVATRRPVFMPVPIQYNVAPGKGGAITGIC